MKLVAYVDGSYASGVYGGGCVFLYEGTENPCYYKCFGDSNSIARLHNVAGELIAALSAISYASQLKGCTDIEINYDYEGIEKWVTGAWEAKKEVTMKYRDLMREARQHYNITFNHTTAHTGIKYNEIADQLAKEAVREKLREKKK